MDCLAKSICTENFAKGKGRNKWGKIEYSWVKMSGYKYLIYSTGLLVQDYTFKSKIRKKM